MTTGTKVPPTEPAMKFDLPAASVEVLEQQLDIMAAQTALVS